MVQVLHLLSGEPDFQAARSAEAIRLAAAGRLNVTVRIMGAGGDSDWRNAVHAAAALRLGSGPGFDVAHVWDEAALVAAAAGGLPVVFSPSGLPAGAGLPRATIECRNVHVVAGAAAARDAFVCRGVPSRRCHVVPPPVDFDRIPRQPDASLRSALGFSESDFVVLAAGESTPVANHRASVHAVSILHVLDRSYRILLWGRGREAPAMTWLARRLRQPTLVTLAERGLARSVDFEELLAAADLALVTGGAAAPTLPLAVCMAAGLPIVAADSAGASELLRDGKNAALVPSRPRLLAKRVLEMREDQVQATRLGRASRDYARRQFDPVRFAGEYRQLYECAAGIEFPSQQKLTICL